MVHYWASAESGIRSSWLGRPHSPARNATPDTIPTLNYGDWFPLPELLGSPAALVLGFTFLAASLFLPPLLMKLEENLDA
jgi:hypothetical protein